jgi:signal transduction histidine kinase
LLLRPAASLLRRLAEPAAVAAVYYGVARLSLLLAFAGTNASPVWPPSGIAFAAVLRLGYRVWPGIFLGAFLANAVVFAANQAAGLPLLLTASACVAAGNTLEAVFGAFLLRRLTGSCDPLDRARDVFLFVLVAALTCLTSATAGPASLWVAGIVPRALAGTVWFTWWLGDVAGVLVLTPLLLAWSRRPPPQRPPGTAAEAVCFLALLLITGQLVFGPWFRAGVVHYALAFALPPFLLWAAFRFGQRGLVAAAALVSGVAIWGTTHGFGPFVREVLNDSMLLLQAFLGVSTVTGLALTAVLTERYLLEERLRQAQKLEAVGRLAGGIAHDFNNLLTVITGYTDLLLDGPQNAEASKEFLRQINLGGRRAAALTQQILAFSRKQVLVPRVLSLNSVVRDLFDLVRPLIGEEIELVTETDPDLGAVKADPTQLGQVLLNLAVNARDAMPRGGTLTVATANAERDGPSAGGDPDLRPGRYAVLSVADTGCGMSEEVLAHVFEPYFTTKEVGKGAGLGLASVYGIVKQSGGHVEVSSRVGAGTTFRVYLPLVEGPQADAVRLAERQAPWADDTLRLGEDS